MLDVTSLLSCLNFVINHQNIIILIIIIIIRYMSESKQHRALLKHPLISRYPTIPPMITSIPVVLKERQLDRINWLTVEIIITYPYPVSCGWNGNESAPTTISCLWRTQFSSFFSGGRMASMMTMNHLLWIMLLNKYHRMPYHIWDLSSTSARWSSSSTAAVAS